MNALATTFYELFADNLPARADRPALVDGDRSTTYGELMGEVERWAAALAGRGLRPGDRVVVHLRKSVAEVAAMLAVARLGGVVVNVNTQWTLEQLGYVAGDCTARLLIVEPRVAAALAQAAMPPLAADVVTGPDEAGVPPAAVARLDTELAMILYTSGSTGMPKGVMLSHRNIVAGARSVARYLKLGDDERLLGVLPYSFDYGLNQLTTMLLTGGAVIHAPVPMATELVELMRRHAVTGIAAVPPLWNQIVRLLAERPTALPSLRRITNSGGKIPLNILEQLPAVFPGVAVYLMYGLTEAFRSTYLRPERFAGKMGSIGQAIPGAEVFVLKAGGGLARPGEQGELVHRGPLVSLGYWGQPELTGGKIRPCPELSALIGDEPVVYSGDIVRIDGDGDLWFVGRNDAMIKTSGFRVSPDEIEDLICRSGMVGDGVAYGVDDDDLGQIVHAAVTPAPGFDRDALLLHCRRVMPHYMIPRVMHVWDEPMPRTSSGKLARPEVIRGSRALAAPAAAA